MANLTIRNLDDSIKEAYARLAKSDGCSMEAFLRRFLQQALPRGGSADKAAPAMGTAAEAGAAAEGAEADNGRAGLRGRNALVIIGGSVAAYKALGLIRALKEAGAAVMVILTAAAQRFITPLAAAALADGRVYTDLFSREDNQDIGHIRLARAADIIVLAGASASRMAKMAAGLADDLAGAAVLAARAPLLLAPAMNPAMWAHPATQRNVARLKADGCLFIGPDYGEMAESGEAGLGRMSEPAAIAAAAAGILATGKETPAAGKGAEAGAGGAKGGALSGRHIIITSGPTYEALDPVRYIANHSSGKQGHAIAAALARLGARVSLISGPVALPDPEGVEVQHITTALEMQAAVSAALPADAAIFAAAVADWRPRRAAAEKIKKGKTGAAAQFKLELVENPDILAGIGHHRRRPALVIGFAAETLNLPENAAAKLAKKGADWIIANNVAKRADNSSVMGGDSNHIYIFSHAGTEEWPEMPKTEIAAKLAEKIAAFFTDRDG